MDFDAVTSGNRLALSRLLTEVENETSQGLHALDKLFVRSGKAHLVGITGAPGTGKSTLVSCITRSIRKNCEKTVAIVAVDPSSPFTGGAILGDRVRMRELSGDTGVFIRSMATRGELGGLARATAGVVQVLDAAGFDLILIETVGAGQNEVDIARLAHTTIVVDSPGMGDDIQAIKAGILEIADILVINKADRPGVENTERALRVNLELGYSLPVNHKPGHLIEMNDAVKVEGSWTPPVLKTIATQNKGIDEVAAAIFEHRKFLMESGMLILRDQERLRTEMEHKLQAALVQKWKEVTTIGKYEQVIQSVFSRKLSPGAAVNLLTGESSAHS